MLELHKVKVALADRQFQFSMRVEQAETVVILGPSGAGKSTLLNLIGGFLKPGGGDITWNGNSIVDLSPDQRPTTTLFQKHNLFEHLSVWKNVALGFHPGAKLDSGQMESVRQALASVALSGFEQRMPNDLSGGEQQRVALARCLVAARPVLLLDEPYSALDQDLRVQMLALTREIVASNGLCTLLVTHDANDAQVLNARVAKLIDGQLLVDG